jgi:hypothetical protein
MIGSEGRMPPAIAPCMLQTVDRTTPDGLQRTEKDKKVQGAFCKGI